MPECGMRECEMRDALASWGFNFSLTTSYRLSKDTTRFSVVEFQFQPNNKLQRLSKTPHALASWSFNFGLTTSYKD